MKANTEPIQTGCRYHIYNRGINSEKIFRTEVNYQLFLKKYVNHLHPVVKTYAYCLMGNHFHLLLEIRSADEIRNFFIKPGQPADYQLKFSNEERITRFVSSQFGHLFNGYAQAFNRSFKRTGGLFEETFRRIKVHSDPYFTALIKYIHLNPQLHGFVDHFTNYPHSSYQSHISEKATKLERQYVLDWFGGRDAFIKAHSFQASDHLEIEW